MDSRKKISISFRNQTKETLEIDQAKREQAAAEEQLKESSDSNGEQSALPKLYHLPVKKSKNGSTPIKRLMLTAGSALVLSLALGFLLLRMFVTLTDTTSEGTSQVSVPAAAVEADSKDQLTGSPDLTLETFVVQAGVFSTRETAELWEMKLNDLAVPSFIWERGDQFYLFTGAFSEKGEADERAEDLNGRSIETYVKPWTVMIDSDQLPDLPETTLTSMFESFRQKGRLSVTTEDREQWIETLEGYPEAGALVESLQEWDRLDEENLNWLQTVYQIEKMANQ